ncbi:MAG TPA: hypothetical protein VIN03_11910 [Roseateles sp.]
MTNDDKALLELAAKAAGFSVLGTLFKLDAEGRGTDEFQCLHTREFRYWNPLADDGDALRLAAKLGISVSYSHSTRLDVPYPTITEVGAFAGWCPTFTEINHDDWAAATRRAIVRAAAAIAT